MVGPDHLTNAPQSMRLLHKPIRTPNDESQSENREHNNPRFAFLKLSVAIERDINITMSVKAGRMEDFKKNLL